MSTPQTRPGYARGRRGRAATRLAGLVGAVGLTVLGTGPAALATTTDPSPSASPTDGATPSVGDEPSDVFVGVVDGVEVTRSAGGAGSATYDVDITVLSVYRGDIRTESVAVVGTRAYGRCLDRAGTMPPEAGMQYAFRVTDSGNALQATSCNDIQRASALVRRALSAQYPDVRPPVAPEATFDDVAFAGAGLSDPTAFTRAAAPGLALVLVGLLGLVLARQLGRPRS